MPAVNFNKSINSSEFDSLITKASTYQFPKEKFELSELKTIFTPAMNVRGEQALITEGRSHRNGLIAHIEKFEYDPKQNPITVMRYKNKLYAIDGYHRTISLLAIDKYKDSSVYVQVIEVKSELLFNLATRFLGLILNATNAPSMANSKMTLEHLVDKYYDDMEGDTLKRFLMERVGGNETDIKRIYARIKEARDLGEAEKKLHGSVKYINYTTNEGRAVASKLRNEASKSGFIVSQGNQADAVEFFGSFMCGKFIPLWLKDKTIKGKFFVVPRVSRCPTPLGEIEAKLEALIAYFRQGGLNITLDRFPIQEGKV